MPYRAARPLPLVVAALLALACGTAGSGPPDVVLIDLESVRTDHLSHAGYALPTAVRLDSFRAGATLFTAARAPSSASVTSSASLLTGLDPRSHRVGGRQPRLGPETPTLAEILGEHGWHTAGVSHHPQIGPDGGFDRGFEGFEAAFGAVEDHPDASALVAWVREWLSTDPASPFFLYLHPMNAGGPYPVPRSARSALLGRPPKLLLPYSGELMRALAQPGRTQLLHQIGEAEVRSLVEQYDTALRYTLDQVADVLQLLERSGRLENALVVVTANHGEELFEHRGLGHGRTLHEEVLRVPLYLKLRDGGGPATLDTRVSLSDVVPTVLELVGIDAGGFDGRSLAPLLRGEAGDAGERDFVHELDAPHHHVYGRALLRDRLKLIESRPARASGRRATQLYDLVIDPTEQQDLSATSPEVVRQLRSDLDRIAP